VKQVAYNPRDRYFKKAKLEGYRSRAAYKLIELQQRFRLMRPGGAIVDLGAAPGGWLQVAAKTIGSQGKIVGVDLETIQSLNQPNIIILQGDITDPVVHEKIKTLMGGPADSVLSDLAPKLSGIRDADMARCFELNQTALRVAIDLLRPGGSLLIKSFISADLQAFTNALKNHFSEVQRTKPDATRQGSSEFYFYAKGFTPAPEPTE
jgi:23S rRNA (uridine2552-2'-O)-methyltransferase